MIWAWPQITLACFMAVQVLCIAAFDGKPRKGNHSFAITLCRTAVLAFLLYMGGFWS
jgi:hypothetical protein